MHRRDGAKLPSIRQFAHSHAVSVYTVVDAYDRLVALGFFASRAHSGFFVRGRATGALAQTSIRGNYTFDSMWYMRRIFENRALRSKPGCGWLPNDWLFAEGVKRSLRNVAADETIDLGGYGEPKGYLPLRQLVRDILAEPIRNFGLAKDSKDLDERVAKLMDTVRLPRDAVNRW